MYWIFLNIKSEIHILTPQISPILATLSSPVAVLEDAMQAMLFLREEARLPTKAGIGLMCICGKSILQ